MRTEREIENEAEPIIEVRDRRVLAVRLEPVPADQIRLNDVVVLPGLGELSPVIGVWPCPDRYARRLCVCTDNGDWASRPADSPVLRADIQTLVRHGHLATLPVITGQVPGPESLAPQRFRGQVKKDRPTNDERIPMSATITTETTAVEATPGKITAAADPFALDVRIITDVPPGHPLAGCKGGTDDGCDPTCASACISDGG